MNWTFVRDLYRKCWIGEFGTISGQLVRPILMQWFMMRRLPFLVSWRTSLLRMSWSSKKASLLALMRMMATWERLSFGGAGSWPSSGLASEFRKLTYM